MDIEYQEKLAKNIVNKIEITNMALQKLLYYIEMFFSVLHHLHAFNNKYNAWEYGPVYGTSYHKHQ